MPFLFGVPYADALKPKGNCSLISLLCRSFRRQTVGSCYFEVKTQLLHLPHAIGLRHGEEHEQVEGPCLQYLRREFASFALRSLLSMGCISWVVLCRSHVGGCSLVVLVIYRRGVVLRVVGLQVAGFSLPVTIWFGRLLLSSRLKSLRKIQNLVASSSLVNLLCFCPSFVCIFYSKLCLA